jgi:FMN phosphatase YigB (HAD superfamily)
MTPLVIFDLDGTLADITHRRHYVEGEKKDWKSFFLACVNDKPLAHTCTIARMLASWQYEVWIFSGRSDIVKDETVAWLEKNSIQYKKLLMRKNGDYTPDDILKKKWLDEMDFDDRTRLQFVFEDRDRLV